MESRSRHRRTKVQELGEVSLITPCCCSISAHPNHTDDGYAVYSDFDETLPSVSNDEIALLRAFLSEEIRAILNDDDQGG